jgi:putative ABC transport system permease protein
MLDAHALQDGADAEFVAARTRAGVSMSQLAEALRREAVRWHDLRPDEYDPARRHTLTVFGFVENFGRDLRSIVLLIFAAVTFMLLIACVNVAGVQLVRGTVKANEVAIRSALGASRWRLLRRSLVESILLAVGGGVAGVALGALGIAFLQSWHPAAYPTLSDVRLDGRIVTYALGLTALVGCAVALIPGMPVRHIAGRGASMSRDRHRTLRGIAVAQVALTLVLLLGSGLMIRSLGLVLRVDPGFDAARVYAGRVMLSETRYRSREAATAFYDGLTARLRAMPGVTAAGAALGVPFAEMDGASSPFFIVGRPEPTTGTPQHSLIQPVTPGYFAAMGIPLRAGRNFTAADVTHGPVVAIIDEEVARLFFAGVNPIGQRITGQMDTATIVGVVASVGHHELGAARKATIYYAQAQNTAWSMQVVIRTTTELRNPVAFLQSAVSEIDRDVPVSHVASMRQRIDASVESRRTTMIAMTAFAAASLALAVLGLYGVISYGTTVRTHEFGIRMALGASAGELLALVMRSGVGLVVAGLGIGFALFLAVSRVLSSFLYGIGPRDPLTLIGSAVVLAACTMLACWLPARRAASTDPMAALRDPF